DVPIPHALPGLIAEWQMADAPVDFEPHWVGAQTKRAARYRLQDDEVSVVVAHYPGGLGRPTSSENVLVKSADANWQSIDQGLRALPEGELNEAVIVGRAGRFVAWSGLKVGEVITARRSLAAARLAWARLTGRAEDVAWVVFYTREEGAARARLARFVSQGAEAVAGPR
ncbi:MAG: hypothetical protein RIR70_1974, partial [Pseudomonadota bacterium]